jgi:Asp-tRNA(Asn)/Glu-tRNA(Gln) amidotransferase B subunit
MDVPASVLAQLGLKVQHALRAFTAADRKTIKQTAENYPETEFYKTEDLITQLGIGEALITMLNEKGIPTPLVHAMLFPPRSRMDILTAGEIDNIVSHSKLGAKYNQAIDSVSAYEILTGKLQQATQQADQQKQVQQQTTGRTAKKDDSFFDNPAVKQMERTAASVLTRSLLGVLGLGGRRKKSIF